MTVTKLAGLLAAGAFAFSILPAAAEDGSGAWEGHAGGHFLGHGLVLSAATSDDAVPCPTAAGDRFTAILQVKPHGHGFVVRESENNASVFGVAEQVFPDIPAPATVETGTYQYGFAGGSLTDGTYSIEFVPLDTESFLGDVTTTYLTPNGGGATCTEEDQIDFIRTGR